MPVDKIKVIVTDRDGNGIMESSGKTVQSVKWQLNGPGEATIKLPTKAQNARDSLIHPSLGVLPRPGLDEVQIWINENLSWWGYLDREAGQPRDTSIILEGILGYFKKRFVWFTTLDYPGVDQFSILAGLVAFAQAGGLKDLNIAMAAVSPSGVSRTKTYDHTEHANIYDAILDFATLEAGFDVDIVLFGDGRREITPYYPAKGTYKPKMRLEFGKQIIDYSRDKSFSAVANDVIATGGSDATTKYEMQWYDAGAQVAMQAVYQSIISEGTQIDTDWLRDRAHSEVDARKRVLDLPTVTCKDGDVLITQVVTGDIVPVVIDNGRTQVNGDYRIVTVDFRPQDNTCLLTFNPS